MHVVSQNIRWLPPDQQSKDGILSIGLSDCVVCFFQDGKHAGDGDTISLFVFDENEHELAQEASQNNGVVDYHKVAHHHYPDLQLSKAKTDVRYHVISGVTHTENALSSFHGSSPSFCCTIYINPLFGIVRSNYLHEFLDFFVVVVFHIWWLLLLLIIFSTSCL